MKTSRLFDISKAILFASAVGRDCSLVFQLPRAKNSHKTVLITTLLDLVAQACF